MEFGVWTKGLATLGVDCLVLGVFEEAELSPEAKQLDDYSFGRAVAELTGAALYRVNDLKTGKKAPASALAKVLAGPVRKAQAAERGLAHGAAVAAAAQVQRDLANLPANVCT